MLVSVTQPRTPTNEDNTFRLNLVVGEEEACTIIFALKEYHDKIVKDLEESIERSHMNSLPDKKSELEDEMFLANILWKVDAVLWDLTQCEDLKNSFVVDADPTL